jgi:hypothetical protein
MKNKKYTNSKNTKFVRINNSTWIEADAWIPDEVARLQFLQKLELTKPIQHSGQPKNDHLVVRN